MSIPVTNPINILNMPTNFNVASLPAYVATNRDMLLKDIALGGDFIKRIGVQTGVKKDAYLNILDIAPVFADGATCGFESLGTGTISQRTIAAAPLKINQEYCARTLVGKYAEWMVRMNANDPNSLPFDEYILKGLVAEINKNVEKMLWQGDTTSADPVLKWANGLLKIAAADVPAGQQLNTASTHAKDGILAVAMALPEEVLVSAQKPMFLLLSSMYTHRSWLLPTTSTTE